MAILLRDLRLFGSAVMPDDDSVTAIGGAISTSKQVEFVDVNGMVQIVSDSPSDTVPSVTLTFRSSLGTLLTQVKALNGTTPVAMATFVSRIMKAVKSGITVGNIALEAVAAERTGTAQGGDTDMIVLDSGASATDDFYNGMVIRLTAGTGVGQLRRVVDYQGSTRKAFVDQPWVTTPAGDTTFRAAKGIVFPKAPHEVTEVRRAFYNGAADPPGGSNRKYYEKVFYKNNHASLPLTSAVVKERSDPSGLIAFGVASTLNDSGTNGAFNRQTAPAAITFNSLDKNVANSQSLTNGSAQGIWLELTLNAGAAALDSSYKIGVSGDTSA